VYATQHATGEGGRGGGSSRKSSQTGMRG
jgi:hypothetical protein